MDIKQAVKNWALMWERRFASIALKRKRGFVYVVEHSLGSKHTEEKNIAGSCLIAHFDRHQISNMTRNGHRAKPYDRLVTGDILDVYVRPNDLDTSQIVSIVIGVALLFNPGTQGAGVALLVGTGVGIVTRLLTPSPDKGGSSDETVARASIRGSENTISRESVPVLFGEHLQTPFYGQLPYRLVTDGSAGNKFRQYFVANYNDVNTYDEKLGETLLSDFSSEYLTYSNASGVGDFFGFDNVKSNSKEYQLTVAEGVEVSQSHTETFASLPSGISYPAEAVIRFSNVDLSNWGNKTFQLQLPRSTGGFLYRQVTVTSSDLTFVSTGVYDFNWTGSVFSSADGSRTLKIVPITNTRVTIEEFDNGLETRVVSMSLKGVTNTMSAGINKYNDGVESEVVDTSPSNTSEIDFIFAFPQGLFLQNNDGSRASRTSKVVIEYKQVGASTWSAISSASSIYVRDIEGDKQPLSSSTTTVSGSEVTFSSPNDITLADELFHRTIGMALPSGKYTVRVRSADFGVKTSSDIGTPYLSEVNHYVDGDVINTDMLPDVNQISLDAVAYQNLSGELKMFNYIGKLECPVWNGTNWDDVEETRNPASVVRYLLTDRKVNPRPESVSSIDNDSLVALYNFCETQNFYADGVVTEPTKIGEVIARILDNCRASFTLLEGKYVFVIDDPTGTPLDMFTPHNSWEFQWLPNVGKSVDALRLTYINEADGYIEDQVSLYYYDGDVHEEPKTGTSDFDYEFLAEKTQFITNKAHLVSRYSYSLRNLQEKRNKFEFKVNLEGLSRRLFDKVYIANTCDMTEEASGNIKNVVVDGGNITGFEFYDFIDIPSGASIVIRSIDTVNETSVTNVYPVANSGRVKTALIDPVANNGIIKGAGKISGFSSGYEWDYSGDLFEIGVGKIYTAVITNIRYNEDLTATIEAREA